MVLYLFGSKSDSFRKCIKCKLMYVYNFQAGFSWYSREGMNELVVLRDLGNMN